MLIDETHIRRENVHIIILTKKVKKVKAKKVKNFKQKLVICFK